MEKARIQKWSCVGFRTGKEEGRGTHLANVPMERKTPITSKRPDQSRCGGQRGNSTANGHDEHDGDHGVSTAPAPNGLIEDLHVGETEGTGGTFENGVDVGGHEKNSDNDGETEGAVEEGGDEHGPRYRPIGIGDLFGHLRLGEFEGEWGRVK